jgi:amidase
MKPGRGALPNPYGSMDPAGISSIGPLATNVRDAAALMDVLAGGGRHYATGVDAAIPSKLRIKILLSTTITRVDPDCAASAATIAKQLEAMGHSLAPAAPYIASIDEFLPIMARMVARVPLLPFAERLLEPSTRFLRSWGRTFTNEQVAERAAQLRQRVSDWFGDTDVLVTPTVAMPPPKVGAFAGMSGEEKLRACAPLGAFTAPFNISGQPAITIPAARSNSGLPLGVQLVGRPRSDRMLLGLAARLGF